MSSVVGQSERDEWWDNFDAAYAVLRANPAASAEFDAEMAELDGVLLDGLDEWPYDGLDELLKASDERSASGKGL